MRGRADPGGDAYPVQGAAPAGSRQVQAHDGPAGLRGARGQAPTLEPRQPQVLLRFPGHKGDRPLNTLLHRLPSTAVGRVPPGSEPVSPASPRGAGATHVPWGGRGAADPDTTVLTHRLQAKAGSPIPPQTALLVLTLRGPACATRSQTTALPPDPRSSSPDARGRGGSPPGASARWRAWQRALASPTGVRRTPRRWCRPRTWRAAVADETEFGRSPSKPPPLPVRPAVHASATRLPSPPGSRRPSDQRSGAGRSARAPPVTRVSAQMTPTPGPAVTQLGLVRSSCQHRDLRGACAPSVGCTAAKRPPRST